MFGRMSLRWLGVSAGLLVGGACSTGSGRVSPERLVVYPAPPDTARIQFLTSFTSEEQFGKGGKSLFDQIVGREGDKAKKIAKPYGLAIHQGVIYVCDQDIRGLDLVDLNLRTFEFFQPEREASMRTPVNCYVDDAGTLYVTDTGLRRVLRYGPDGTYLGHFGGENEGAPVDVAVSGDRIYVSNIGAGRGVRVYDRATREYLFHFPEAAGGDSIGLVAPTNITVRNGKVYAADLLKQHVLVFSTDGEYLQTIGRPGEGPSTFQRPKGVAVDPDGLVYVADAAFANVQVFGPEGRLLMYFGGNGERPGDMWLPAKVVIDYDHLEYFREYVDPAFELKYLIFVTNQFGPAKVNVYGFIGPSAYVIPPEPVDSVPADSL